MTAKVVAIPMHQPERCPLIPDQPALSELQQIVHETSLEHGYWQEVDHETKILLQMGRLCAATARDKSLLPVLLPRLLWQVADLAQQHELDLESLLVEHLKQAVEHPTIKNEEAHLTASVKIFPTRT